MAALGIEEKGAVVVTAQEGWHPGVVGLVAARLKERFGRPAFAIALEPGGTGTGSGRSIAGVDLGCVVRQAVRDGLLIKGGGHAMAAGVTLRKEGARGVSRFSRGGFGQVGGAVAARRCAQDRRRCERRRRHAGFVRVAGKGRTLWRRQSGTGAGAAGAHIGLCRPGRREPHSRPLQIRRRQVRQRDYLSRCRYAARQGADRQSRDGRCTRPAISPSTAGRARNAYRCGSPMWRRASRRLSRLRCGSGGSLRG